jgi:hypothetical protein
MRVEKLGSATDKCEKNVINFYFSLRKKTHFVFSCGKQSNNINYCDGFLRNFNLKYFHFTFQDLYGSLGYYIIHRSKLMNDFKILLQNLTKKPFFGVWVEHLTFLSVIKNLIFVMHD